jgi:queuosine precursor transporter
LRAEPYKYNNNMLIVLLSLTSIYVLFLLASSVFINKLITVFGHITTLSAFFFPMTVLISNIALEVYGYKVARAMVWAGLFVQFLFAVFAKISLQLAQPIGYDINAHYSYVLHNLVSIYFGALAAAFIADFINIYLLSKLKALTKGKYFAWRVAICGTVGNFFYTSICCLVIYYPYQSLSNVLHIGIMIYNIKIIFIYLLSIPASYLANFIKIKAKIDVFDYNINFNPFRIFDK